MALTRDKDIGTIARTVAADDWNRKDGATNGTRRISPMDEAGQFRNALAPRGGVAFEGSGAQVLVTLTSQSVGTDSFSISEVFRVPSANPSVAAILAALNSSSTSIAGSSLRLELTTAGTLIVEFYNAAGSSTRVLTVANFVTNYGGKVVHVAFVRNSSAVTGTIYINGVAVTATETTTGGTPPTWADSITSTYFFSGRVPSSQVLVGAVYALSLYNLALSAADVVEIYELGGAVPERFKFGSQVSNTASPGGYNPGGKTISAFTATTFAVTAGTGSCYMESRPAAPLPKGMYVRISGNVSAWSGSGGASNSVSYGLGIPASFSVLGGNYQAGYTGANNIASGNTFSMSLRGTGAFSTTFLTYGPISCDACFDIQGDYLASIDSIKVTPFGAVVHLPLDDGLGYQLQDVSTNRLHALATTTGISHVAPLYGPARIRTTTDGTTAAQKLCGGTTLPANSQITKIRARAQSGTPNMILGVSSGGATVVASVALSTPWKDLTIALTGGIVTSATDLWTTISAANVVEIDVTWEPLSP